jgi:hypothetical protein
MGLLQGKFLTEFLSQNTVTDGVYNAATWCPPHGVATTTRKRDFDMTMEAKNTREYRLYHNITTPEQEMQGLEAKVRNLREDLIVARQERDEARRLYCVMRDGEDGMTCKEWADRKNWDCFKENTDV